LADLGDKNSKNRFFESLFLLSGPIENISEIKNLIEKTKTKIICFDYVSHKKINENNWKHNTIDDFLSEKDYKIIDQTALRLSTTWYKNSKFDPLLNIEKINLGWLLEYEVYFYLLKILTIVTALRKINEKYQNCEIFSSKNLTSFVDFIISHPKILIKNKESNERKFRSDVFHIKYNIGPIPISFSIDREKFFKLRKYYGRFIIPCINWCFSRRLKKSRISFVNRF